MGDFRVQLDWGIHGAGVYDAPGGKFIVGSGHDGGNIGLDDLVGFALRDVNARIFRIRGNTATLVSGGSFEVECFGIAPQPNPIDGNITIDSPAAFYEIGGGLVSAAPPASGWPTIYTINPTATGFQPTSFLTDIFTEDVKLGARMQNSLLTPVSAETPLTTFVEPPVAGVGQITIVSSTKSFPACIGFPPSDFVCAPCADRTRLVTGWLVVPISGTVDNTTHKVRISRRGPTGGFTVKAEVSPFGNFGDCSPLVVLPNGSAGWYQDHFLRCNYQPGVLPQEQYDFKVELIRISDLVVQDSDIGSLLTIPAYRYCV